MFFLRCVVSQKRKKSVHPSLKFDPKNNHSKNIYEESDDKDEENNLKNSQKLSKNVQNKTKPNKSNRSSDFHEKVSDITFFNQEELELKLSEIVAANRSNSAESMYSIQSDFIKTV